MAMAMAFILSTTKDERSSLPFSLLIPRPLGAYVKRRILALFN